MKILKNAFLPITIALVLTMAGCADGEQGESAKPIKEEKKAEVIPYEIQHAAPQRIDQIYGLGYPGNDEGLYIASDDGMKIFSNGEWLESNSQKHEYTGFQAVHDGFITSGHPQEGSDLKDPLGIVKSVDKGATLDHLAFDGELDFHFLSAGYQSNVMYIINNADSDALDPGVYSSDDLGASWNPVKLNDFDADSLGMIAVHPTDDNLMAMATRSGIYLSEDKGNHMKKITDTIMVTAIAFSNDSLYYSSVENNNVLFRSINLDTMESASIDIPFLNYDNPITYITVNQKNQQTIAFSTYLFDVYQSANNGGKWDLVMKNGKIEE